MSPESEIPENVVRFIEANIDTVPELETLLMMSREEHRAWSVAEVAARNYIAEQHAQETVNALRRRGLLSPDESPDRFRFNPATPEKRALVAELALYYQANLSRITMFIHSKPSASIKEFARAFDLKKDR